ncbi:JAB domain-containing protein [Bacillus sp. S2(2024)]
MLNNAASIICFHNHPSSHVEPSREDLEVTGRLAKSGEILGISLLDHVIIADNKFISLKNKGYMNFN